MDFSALIKELPKGIIYYLPAPEVLYNVPQLQLKPVPQTPPDYRVLVSDHTRIIVTVVKDPEVPDDVLDLRGSRSRLSWHGPEILEHGCAVDGTIQTAIGYGNAAVAAMLSQLCAALRKQR